MQTFSVVVDKSTIYISGKLHSLSAPDFARAIGTITIPKTSGRIDFTGCTLFSTACYPPLQEFFARCKEEDKAITCVTGDALRRTISLVGVPLNVKRIDPEDE